MIYLTKKDRDNTRFLLNHRTIEYVEQPYETAIHTQDGNVIHVEESLEEIRRKVILFEAEILRESRKLLKGRVVHRGKYTKEG